MESCGHKNVQIQYMEGKEEEVYEEKNQVFDMLSAILE